MSIRKQCFGCDVWFNGEADPNKKYCERCQEELDAIRPTLRIITGGKDATLRDIIDTATRSLEGPSSEGDTRCDRCTLKRR